MQFGLLAEKVVGARSRYTLLYTRRKSYRTTVPLCATYRGVQVSCDAGVSMQRSCEWHGKSGPVGEITVRARLACCRLWSGCVDVARPQRSKRRHEGGLLELQLHAREGRAVVQEGALDKLISDANSRLTTITKPHVPCTEGPFEDAERRQSVRFSHESSHAHPVQSHPVSRGGE